VSRLPAAISVIRRGLPRFDDEPEDATDPAILMEWIQGPTLMQGVSRAARTGNANVIRALSAAFVQAWNEMRAEGMIHGDYTADNLLVRSTGQIACVDLDDASWPDAPLGASGQGSPAYRHPTLHRDPALRDAYAALVLVTSLAALADNPGLRPRFGDRPEVHNGALLFAPWDLADPMTSEAFAAARERSGRRASELLEALVSASLGNEDDVIEACGSVPNLHPGDLFGSTPADADAGWTVAPVVARMRAHYGEAWPETPDEARELEFPTWTGPVPAPPTPGSQVLPELPPEPDHVTGEDIAELEGALARADEAEVVRIWSQVGEDPRARLLAAEVESLIAAGYDRRVMAESRRKRDPAIVAIADEAARRKIPLGANARALVRQARERIQVRDRLETALAANDRRQLAELAVSGELVVLGDADRDSLQRVLQAIEWPAVQRAIQADDDVLIVAAYDDELFENSRLIDDQSAARISLAATRLRWLGEVRDALRQRKPAALRMLLLDPPDGGPERLSGPERRRMRLAIEQEHALKELGASLANKDDQAVIASLNRVERVGARIPDRRTWADVQQVVERVSLVDDLREASEADPIDYARIAQLLPAVKALGLERDPRIGEEGLVERLEDHLVRMAHMRRIRAAIARDNDTAIVSAAVPDPRDAIALLTEAERARVQQAIAARRVHVTAAT